MNQPSINGPNGRGAHGRDQAGRFAKGNPGGPGNPHARRTAEIRATLISTVSDEDLQDIVRALVGKAKAGDVVAAREVLDRILGKATTPITVGEAEDTGDYASGYPAASIAALQAHIDRLLGQNNGVALEPGSRAALPASSPTIGQDALVRGGA
jgi:hypothetical protein